jgi:RNA-binding protein NOB1
MAASIPPKSIHTLILDTGPLIKNTISISTILASAEEIYTTSAVLSEIRDPATRARVETTLLPFLKVRNPAPASYEAVAAFSKKTGDYPVLSRQDLGVLALAYELHVQKNGGDAGLRRAPGGEIIKGKEEEGVVKGSVKDDGNGEVDKKVDAQEEPPSKEINPASEQPEETVPEPVQEPTQSLEEDLSKLKVAEPVTLEAPESTPQETIESTPQEGTESTPQETTESTPQDTTESTLQGTAGPTFEGGISIAPEDISQPTAQEVSDPQEASQPTLAKITKTTPAEDAYPSPSTSDDDSDGEWITPSNLKQVQARDSGVTNRTTTETQMSIATMTTDFAMQNVLLQMNMNLISPGLQRISVLKTYILRCHACFLTTKEVDKQFCPRCGQPTLNRVSCTTSASGEFKIHLSKTYQHNNRGNKYSVPKPIGGTPSGKLSGKGGGKGGWGRELVLAEDQKEYLRHAEQEKRVRTRDLMDEDYLPGILTGDRGRVGGRMKVGAGKNVNSRKKF